MKKEWLIFGIVLIISLSLVFAKAPSLCTENDWSYSLTPTCSANGEQTKTWTKIGHCVQGIEKPSTEKVYCDNQTAFCSSFKYSEWSECSESGTQKRTVLSSSPQGCQGGNPLITRTCSVILGCNESNWVSVTAPDSCPASGIQTRVWKKVGTCKDGIEKPSTEKVSCNPKVPICKNFTFSEWSECSESGTQKRTVLSSSPQGCQGGNPFLIATCNYVAPCSKNQKKLCERVDNGEVSGFKNRCNEEGTSWVNANTCQISCNRGFAKSFDKCIQIQDYKEKIDKKDSRAVQLKDTTLLTETLTNGTFLELEGLTEKSFFDDTEIIRSRVDEPKEYIIVKNLNLNNITKPIFYLGEITKKIYLARKNLNSNAVCIKDSEGINTLEDIASNCLRIPCPGSVGNYTCAVEESYLVVSGLKHSGVVEDYYYCGDGNCFGQESCSSCSQDCGACPIIQNVNNIGNGGTAERIPSHNISVKSQTTTSNIPITTSSDSGDQDNSYEEINIDTEETETGGSSGFSKIIYWVIGLLGLLIVIVIIILIIIFLGRRKKETVVSDSEKIKTLLDQGERLIQANAKDEARKKYEEISRLYSSLKGKDPVLYSRIMSFYSKL